MANLNGVNVKEVALPQSKFAVKATYPMVAKGLTIHNTWNDASKENEINYMHSNNNYVSYHMAVDDKGVIIGVPFNRSTWHAGDGANGYGNRNHLALEICYSKSGGERYKKSEENAVKVAAQILHDNKWAIDKMKKHQDWSGKNCPHRILNEKRWTSIVKRVAAELDRLNGKTQTKPAASTQPTQPSSAAFKVGDMVTVSHTIKRYATGENVSNFVKGSTYKVKAVKSDRVLLDGINSWVLNGDVIKGAQTNAQHSKIKPTNITPIATRLKRGDTGQHVKELQRMLCNVFFYPDKVATNKGVDGIYGPKTESAVRRFQMVYLPREVDGIAGQNTISKLKALQ